MKYILSVSWLFFYVACLAVTAHPAPPTTVRMKTPFCLTSGKLQFIPVGDTILIQKKQVSDVLLTCSYKGKSGFTTSYFITNPTFQDTVFYVGAGLGYAGKAKAYTLFDQHFLLQYKTEVNPHLQNYVSYLTQDYAEDNGDVLLGTKLKYDVFSAGMIFPRTFRVIPYAAVSLVKKQKYNTFQESDTPLFPDRIYSVLSKTSFSPGITAGFLYRTNANFVFGLDYLYAGKHCCLTMNAGYCLMLPKVTRYKHKTI
jgi:hypothetical protein